MTARSAREIYQLLADAGVRCWVVGGWGIDALLGRETRSHKDLDILLVRGEHPAAWDLLQGSGFRLDHTWEENTDPGGDDGEGRILPTAYVLIDTDGRQVDVHVLEDDLSPLWITDRTFIEGALDATGTIDDLNVACMSAPMQRIAHTGYVLPEYQQRDLAALSDAQAIVSRARRAGGS